MTFASPCSIPKWRPAVRFPRIAQIPDVSPDPPISPAENETHRSLHIDSTHRPSLKPQEKTAVGHSADAPIYRHPQIVSAFSGTVYRADSQVIPNISAALDGGCQYKSLQCKVKRRISRWRDIENVAI